MPLRSLANVLPKSLSLLFNSIANKKFPQQWKTGEIISLYKDGDQQSMANYRPTTLLSCLSKSYESLFFCKLNGKLESTIAPQQYGFTMNRSTVTQVIMYFLAKYTTTITVRLLGLKLWTKSVTNARWTNYFWEASKVVR